MVEFKDKKKTHNTNVYMMVFTPFIILKKSPKISNSFLTIS